MPEAIEAELAKEFAALTKQAAEIDAAAAGAEIPEPEAEPKAAQKPQKIEKPKVEAKSAQKPIEEGEPVESEEQKEPEVEEPEEVHDESGEAEPATSKEDERTRKDNERFDRSWKRLETEKSEVRKLRRELEEAKKVYEKQADPIEKFKDEEGHTASQWEAYATQCEQNDDYRSAYMAKQQANKVRAQAMQNHFAERWRETHEDVVAEEEDMQNMLSPLFREVDGLIRNDTIFRAVPEGMRYAVEFAKARLQGKQVAELQAQNQTLNKEITRLNGLLGINGGGTHRSTKPKSFNDMTSEEQFAHLLDQAKELDQG
jgi:hypothetical protein